MLVGGHAFNGTMPIQAVVFAAVAAVVTAGKGRGEEAIREKYQVQKVC
jgi:hypothetical protein